MFSTSGKRNRPRSVPEIPCSLRSESIEMSDMRKISEAPADTAPHITPYLNLRSRLSQIWINRWTILLLLVLVRVLILLSQLREDIGDAKTKALSACDTVEDMGSAIASMPHYLSVGVNDLAAVGITKAVHGMVDALELILEGVEGIIIFYIDFVTSTYVCLLTALIHGSLDVMASVTQDATKAFNDIIDDAIKEINSTSNDLDDSINNLVNGIEKSFLGKALPQIPKADFSKPIDTLQGFDLNSTDFVKGVQDLNKTIPTFAQVQNLTKEAISMPFNLVRNAVNQSFGDYSFQKDVFPLAQKKQLTFCSDNSTLDNFFKELYKIAEDARIAFCVVLVILAILAMAPMAWLEMRRWHKQKKHAKLIQKHRYDPVDVVYIASRPLTASWGIRIASPFSGKRQVLVRWCVAYATSTPAVFVLSLAIAGFFSCLCQYILLKAIQKEVPVLSKEVGNFANEVVQTLQNVSKEWANDANGVITDVNNDINNDVLGWVVNATAAVNNTLSTFLKEMNDGLDTAFNGTVLLDPIRAVMYCVIGNKIVNVEHGLTWVHNHAHVELPLLNDNIFSLGANESINGDSNLQTFLATPQSATTNDVSAAVDHVTNWLHNHLIQEALLSTGLILVYVIVVLLGVLRTLAGMATPSRGRAEGGLRYTGDDRPPLSPRSPQLQRGEPQDGFAQFGSIASEARAYGGYGELNRMPEKI